NCTKRGRPCVYPERVPRAPRRRRRLTTSATLPGVGANGSGIAMPAGMMIVTAPPSSAPVSTGIVVAPEGMMFGRSIRA
ncbi:hypothetical protein FRC20_000644, partial [Serendipita sp. 405]